MSLNQRARSFGQWLVLGSVVGGVCGVASAVFLYLLDRATWFRTHHEGPSTPCPLAGLVIGALYDRFGKSIKGGNNLVIDTVHEDSPQIPLRMGPWCCWARCSPTSSAAAPTSSRATSWCPSAPAGPCSPRRPSPAADPSGVPRLRRRDRSLPATGLHAQRGPGDRARCGWPAPSSPTWTGSPYRSRTPRAWTPGNASTWPRMSSARRARKASES